MLLHIFLYALVHRPMIFSHGCLLPNNSYSCGCLCLREAFSGQQKKNQSDGKKGKKKKKTWRILTKNISVTGAKPISQNILPIQTPNYHKLCTKHLTIPLPQPSPPSLLYCGAHRDSFLQNTKWVLTVSAALFLSCWKNGFAFEGYGQMAKIMQKRVSESLHLSFKRHPHACTSISVSIISKSVHR